jgi:hypothetical protein
LYHLKIPRVSVDDEALDSSKSEEEIAALLEKK